jgi:hypothetical protein
VTSCHNCGAPPGAVKKDGRCYYCDVPRTPDITAFLAKTEEAGRIIQRFAANPCQDPNAPGGMRDQLRALAPGKPVFG